MVTANENTKTLSGSVEMEIYLTMVSGCQTSVCVNCISSAVGEAMKQWQWQNIHINMPTLSGNRWKDEWWLKENWRRDTPRACTSWNWAQQSRDNTSVRPAHWWTDCDISRWVWTDTARALWPRPRQHPPPHRTAKRSAASAGNQSVMHFKEESIITPYKNAHAAYEWEQSSTQEKMRQIKRNFWVDKVRVVLLRFSIVHIINAISEWTCATVASWIPI